MPVLWPDAFAEVEGSAKPQTGLKLGAPFPGVRLPENYVERPDALNAVKAMLLAEDERTLVVSEIAGLGGLGKSVLATALVLDKEVQSRFSDGILWVTLGQKPDLLPMLGDWIQELDKSRESFSANTLEAASQYLGNLLIERQMLLVVDDVWNSAHAEWFRVGGPSCRVLVTTREALIAGAERYSLDLMTPQEALDLVKGELGGKWTADMEEPALDFAQVLGYLPLAIRLMAVQVARGRRWETLKKAFMQTAKGLRALDYPSVRLADLSEEEQRKYSLQACFQMSLERLKEDSLDYFERFVWLGVLPEDVILQQQMATTLWGVEDWEAEETLLTLYERSFLTSGIRTIEWGSTYRVHDLMHDTARNLIERGSLNCCAQNIVEQGNQGKNPRSNQQNLILAHRQLLEQYRNKIANQCWSNLPNDGYIHRYLTWHMEQGDWIDEIHMLMTISDTQGRNAWFETCDKIGQPAIFVEDVARGWQLAEESNEREKPQAIILQYRYALITATLNNLVGNLPIGMMAEFVKQGFWSVEQAWAYVEQMQNESTVTAAIQLLAPYLSKSLFRASVVKARTFQDEAWQASVLIELTKCSKADFGQLLEAACAIQSESSRAAILIELAKCSEADFGQLLEAACAIQNESSRAVILIELAKCSEADFDRLLEALHKIQFEARQAFVLNEFVKLTQIDLSKVFSAVCRMQSVSGRISVLIELLKLDKTYLKEALSAASAIQSEYKRASVLIELAKLDKTYLKEA
ncbi:MAG: NB-ARC domain-containing protein, partial [Cyanobacteria bacterium P01_F01_bin.86]